MGRTTIEWTDFVFNPWVGCTKVSPGCDHCYAESWAKRAGHSNLWTGARRRTTTANWAQVMKWDAAAKKAGRIDRVFCASLADVFDNQVPQQWRTDLFQLIRWTSSLQWLLLTKRIGNAREMLPEDWGTGYPNAWLGATVVNQEEADRDIPKLLQTPAISRFLSCEPLLGPIDLSIYLVDELHHMGRAPRMEIDWVIAGGESGGGARPMHPQWVRQLRDSCVIAGVSFFFKQQGEWAPHVVVPGGDLGGDVRRGRVMMVHPSGRDNTQVFVDTGGRSTEPGSVYVARVGKKNAGRDLDGRTWDEIPGAWRP